MGGLPPWVSLALVGGLLAVFLFWDRSDGTTLPLARSPYVASIPSCSSWSQYVLLPDDYFLPRNPTPQDWDELRSRKQKSEYEERESSFQNTDLTAQGRDIPPSSGLASITSMGCEDDDVFRISLDLYEYESDQYAMLSIDDWQLFWSMSVSGTMTTEGTWDSIPKVADEVLRYDVRDEVALCEDYQEDIPERCHVSDILIARLNNLIIMLQATDRRGFYEPRLGYPVGNPRWAASEILLNQLLENLDRR